VRDAGCEDEDVAGGEGIFLVEGSEDHFAFESVNAQGTGRVVHGEKSTWRKSHHGQAKGPFLDEGSGGPAVLRQDLLIDHPFVVREVIDEDFAFDRSVH
jgi:hypothetical protein